MILTQLNGKNSILLFVPCLLIVYCFLLSCSFSEKEHATSFTNQAKRGKIYLSRDRNSFIFLDTDSTFILSRARGDIAYKELGVVRQLEGELAFFQGVDLDPFISVSFDEGDSETVSLQFSEQLLNDNEGMVLSIMDTLIYEIKETSVLINKKAIFNKFQTLTLTLPPYFHDWKIWDKVFVSDIKLKSRSGYLTLFHDGSVERIKIGMDKYSNIKEGADSICFKMKVEPTFMICTNCPSRLGIDTLFLK